MSWISSVRAGEWLYMTGIVLFSTNTEPQERFPYMSILVVKQAKICAESDIGMGYPDAVRKKVL